MFDVNDDHNEGWLITAMILKDDVDDDDDDDRWS